MTRRQGAITVLGVIAVAVAWAVWPHSPLPDGVRADRIVVQKAERTLSLYRGPELLRSYRVALGSVPIGHKRREGDGRTPEGNYVIDYRLPDSDFHRALHISYPSPADVRAARSAGADPGGLIMVHGMKDGFGFIGRLHVLVDWTNGCIAVTDREIDEISRLVADGTPIQIEP